jgi:tRNA nucleotidyltransferase (CCA-adding enzyme)
VPPFALYVTYLATDDMPHFQTMIYNYVSRWRDIIPTIDGDDLRQRGLPPGPAYRRILTSLRSAWLDEKISNRNEEAALFEGLLAREKKGEL